MLPANLLCMSFFPLGQYMSQAIYPHGNQYISQDFFENSAIFVVLLLPSPCSSLYRKQWLFVVISFLYQDKQWMNELARRLASFGVNDYKEYCSSVPDTGSA